MCFTELSSKLHFPINIYGIRFSRYTATDRKYQLKIWIPFPQLSEQHSCFVDRISWILFWVQRMNILTAVFCGFLTTF
jgi:hypothetical protein